MQETSIDTLSYYCPTPVFLSMIKFKEFWLTSLTQSNDKLEGLWLLDHWLDKFDSRIPEGRRLIAAIGALVRLELQQNLALGLCFSEARDLLSQWRGYAADGTGFSLNFDRHELQQHIIGLRPGIPISLERIRYGINDIEISPFIRELHQSFFEDAKMADEDSNGRISMSVQRSAVKLDAWKRATRNLFLVKNPAFAEEREWRIIAFDNWEKISGIDFREHSGKISPFVRINFPTRAMKSVILGPNNRTTVDMVENALSFYGFSNVSVRRSEASYRSA